jgi:hypothetical protein
MDVRKVPCPECGKVYSVPVWSKEPRCRVCRALLPVDKLREEQRREETEERKGVRRAA